MGRDAAHNRLERADRVLAGNDHDQAFHCHRDVALAVDRASARVDAPCSPAAGNAALGDGRVADRSHRIELDQRVAFMSSDAHRTGTEQAQRADSTDHKFPPKGHSTTPPPTTAGDGSRYRAGLPQRRPKIELSST